MLEHDPSGTQRDGLNYKVVVFFFLYLSQNLNEISLSFSTRIWINEINNIELILLYMKYN